MGDQPIAAQPAAAVSACDCGIMPLNHPLKTSSPADVAPHFCDRRRSARRRGRQPQCAPNSRELYFSMNDLLGRVGRIAEQLVDPTPAASPRW